MNEATYYVIILALLNKGKLIEQDPADNIKNITQIRIKAIYKNREERIFDFSQN